MVLKEGLNGHTYRVRSIQIELGSLTHLISKKYRQALK